jgi:hypothetical protein
MLALDIPGWSDEAVGGIRNASSSLDDALGLFESKNSGGKIQLRRVWRFYQ